MTEEEREAQRQLDRLNREMGLDLRVAVKDAEEDPPACCCKHKHREAGEYQALLRRLSRIEGQVRGVRGMVEKEAYCTDILTQVSAIQSALNAFSRELLANHIRTCVVDGIRQNDPEIVDELVRTVERLMK